MHQTLPQGILKMTPASFVVQELSSPGVPVPLHEETEISGRAPDGEPVTLFHLVKKGMTTHDALRQVAQQFNVRMDDISHHGMKDRHAHTAQEIGVRGAFIPQFGHSQIVLKQVGVSTRTLLSNQHAGNRFRIHVLSNAKEISRDAVAMVPNYFGSQRFGTPRGHEVGRLILEGDFDQAIAILREERLGFKLDRLRSRLSSWNDVIFSPELKFEIGMRILQWQSHLWNLRRRELGAHAPERLAMWRPEVWDEYEHLWNPDELVESALKRLHCFDRPSSFSPTNLRFDRKLVGWNFEFDLPSGSYATVLLSQVFDLREVHLS